MQVRVTGTIDHVIFRNEQNGYTVFVLVSDGKELTCVGSFPAVREGLLIEAVGQMTEHYMYGEQLKVSSFTLKTPETKEAVERYLASGVIKGIGKAMAHRIVKKFADDTLRILEEEPERLVEIKGISERKARDIASQTAAQAGMRKAMMFLQNYGISQQLGAKIYKTYGEDMYEILQTNPYRMTEDIDGVGFKTADEIAERVGIDRDSMYRIRSGLLYALSEEAAEGSVYLPEDELVKKTKALLRVPEDTVEQAIMDLAVDRKVVLKKKINENAEEIPLVYSGQYYYLELNSAKMLLDLNIPGDESKEDIEKNLAKLEKSGNIVLEEEQRKAVENAASHNVLILTGGPGTGKTTTINEMIRYFRREQKSVLLAAPTGRAAKRMTETTGYQAQTIHRLLEISSGEDAGSNAHFERNETNPLEADVIIIDEMSMVDIFLMHALLSAIVPGTKLILVGDVNQLPSVGPGAVLKDMIASGAFPCVELTRIFRQAESSDIVINAHKINHGEVISFDNHSKDFFFLKRNDVNVIISNIIELVQKMLPKYVGASEKEIQVLAPMRNGLLGVSRLNRILQRYLNPPDPKKEEKSYGDKLFREGDKVMQIRNNYQISWNVVGKHDAVIDRGSGIFNGDLGIIRRIREDAQDMIIEFDEGRYVEYPFSSLDELELSYATTIHKSQGSEYPAVILPLLGGPKMLMTRNLLYTAVTRAKKCVVILGSEETVNQMIANDMEQRRYTSLDERICELWQVSEKL